MHTLYCTLYAVRWTHVQEQGCPANAVVCHAPGVLYLYNCVVKGWTAAWPNSAFLHTSTRRCRVPPLPPSTHYCAVHARLPHRLLPADSSPPPIDRDIWNSPAVDKVIAAFQCAFLLLSVIVWPGRGNPRRRVNQTQNPKDTVIKLGRSSTRSRSLHRQTKRESTGQIGPRAMFSNSVPPSALHSPAHPCIEMRCDGYSSLAHVPIQNVPAKQHSYSHSEAIRAQGLRDLPIEKDSRARHTR